MAKTEKTDLQMQEWATSIPSPETTIPNMQDVNSPLNQWLKNADLNYNQYWDDSSAANQATAWGMREKNTWEWVATSNVEYNPNASMDNLDYKYWKDAQYANSDSAGYLARRNDEIASALFNAWLVEKADIIQYLANQPWWNNSTEADRVNTVESIWKRLGELGQQNNAEQWWVDTTAMEENIRGEDTSWTLYWKDTPYEWNPEWWIPALSDANSIFASMQESRIAEVKAMVNMWIDSLAAEIATWTSPYWETAMRDFQENYPDQYNAVMSKVKQMRLESNANAIASWEIITTVADSTNTTSEATSYAVDNANSSVSATQLLNWINAILNSNSNANSAEATMDSIATDMLKLKNRLLNLTKEANNVFKWDVPDYIVKAYVNNKSQEIQNQLSILEWRYNAAYDRYKTELSHAEWQAEYDLKKESLAIDWYKAKNSWKTSSSNTDENENNYTVAERNNNPTNMTVDWMEIMWGQLWIDYEVSDDYFINWNWAKQYYAKLIWDPVQTTIRVLDRAVNNWMNPFTTKSWSYINSLWLTTDKWKNMTQEEKENTVKNWVHYEWGNMDNMLYYRQNPWLAWAYSESGYGYMGYTYGYNPSLVDAFESFQKLTWPQFQNILKTYNLTEEQFWKQRDNYFRYQQNEFDAAWVDVITDMAQLWLLLNDAWRIKSKSDWTLDYIDINSWIMFNWDIWAKFEQLLSEKKLGRFAKSKTQNVNYWQVSNAEWEMVEKASTSLKKSAQFNFMWLWPWGTDEWFTSEFMDVLNTSWKATFHEDFTTEWWNTFLSDIKNWRNNINVALLWITWEPIKNSSDTSDLDSFREKTFSTWWVNTWIIATWDYVSQYWI